MIPKLYKHQKIMNKATKKALKQHDHILYALPTGGGKSICMAHLVNKFLTDDKKILVLAPFRKLVFQLEETFTKFKPLVIMGSILRGDRLSKLILSSIDTMNNRLKKGDMRFDNFDYIILDEAHISCNFPPIPKSRMELLYNKYWGKSKFIGFTATPITAKGYRLSGWDTTISKYQTANMISMGFLADYIYKAPKEIDLSSLRSNSLGEYVSEDVEAVTNTPSAVKSVKKLIKQVCQGKKTLIFASSIIHAQLLQKAIPDSTLVHSKLKESDISSVLKDFESSKKGVLINVAMLTAGFNSPSVEILIIARPIKSERVFLQCVGRVLRKHGNKVATIYDMCSCYSINGLPCDLRDFNKVKGEVTAKIDVDAVLVRNKKCGLCNEVNPTIDFTTKKKVTKKAITIKYFCPSCQGLCDIVRKDFVEVDEYQTIKKEVIKVYTNRERIDSVKDMIIKLEINAKPSWSTFIVKSIVSGGKAELLDQQLNKGTQMRTKWTNIMKLKEAVDNEA